MPHAIPRWLKPAHINLSLPPATRAAFLYPITGISHFVTHTSLHPLLTSRLLTTVILSLFVTFTLFLWTFLPQWAFLAIFHRPSSAAFFNTIFLVLSESAAITALLVEAWFIDEQLVDAFDAVLVSRGYEEIVRTHRPVEAVLTAGSQGSELKRLGRPTHKSVYSPFSLRQIVEFVLLLPLNLVPYVGVPAFLWLTGYRAGPFAHYRLFKLMEFSKQEKKEWIGRYRKGYSAFGAMHLVLQLVPLFSMLFLLTSATGSALWAASLLDEEKRREGERDGAERRGYGGRSYDAAGGEYLDDDMDEDAALLA